MIMARNEDGTYSQVGFVKDNAGIDTEYIYDKDGDIVFEKGFTRETSDTVPLTINGIEKDLKAWSITGNTVQNGTPTPENPVEVQAVGDRTGNLFNGEIMQGGILDSNGQMVANATRIRTNKISVSENTIYTISSNLILRNVIAYKNGAFVKLAFDGFSTSNTINSFTVPAGANQIAISFKGNKAGNIDITPDNLEYLMLNEGKTPLPYEPYGYKIPVVTKSDGAEPIITPIYLPTPLYSGEVMRSDGGREVKFGKLVLTGEEAITSHKPFADGTISIRIPSSKAKADGIIYCTHLQNVSFAELYNSEKQGIASHLKDDLDNLYCLISGFTKLTQYKDFFRNEYSAGTPVTVWYQLATPITETFTALQIPTLNGTTVINVDTAVKPTEMYTKYKSSK